MKITNIKTVCRQNEGRKCFIVKAETDTGRVVDLLRRQAQGRP